MPSDSISFLLDKGKELSKLLAEAGTKPKAGTKPIDRVKNVTNDLLDRLKSARQLFNSEEPLVKILQKIEWSLDEFIRHDPNEQRYRTLAKKVDEFRAKIESPKTNQRHRDQSIVSADFKHLRDSILEGADISITDPKLISTLESTREVLSLLPEGAEIKKRDLFLWWKGIHDGSQGDENYETCLTKLVKDGLIEVVAITNKNQTRLSGLVAPHGVWIRKKKKADHKPKGLCTLKNGVALLNIDERSLNSKTFNSISRRQDIIRLAHLGDWKDEPTTYIVVEDTEDMANALKRMRNLRFLSLQGLSGIVKLPLPIYDLQFLLVLNLRGCHNLELLPDGIHRLSSLQYLDLSECYLLDHIPSGIKSLLELTVLKGFIIPRDPNPKTNASLEDLSKLQKLRKLTLRTRRLSFPEKSDLQTLCKLESLISLKLTWVGENSMDPIGENSMDPKHDFDDSSKFPKNIEKLQIEAASKSTATQLMNLINRQIDIKLKKFYVRGGGIQELVRINKDCTVLRLQYLPDLPLDCREIKKTFPEIHRLEMSSDVIYSLLRQSFKLASGSRDEDVGWSPDLKYPDTTTSE